MFPDDVLATAGRLVTVLRAEGLRLVTAESCTGGLIAGALTAIPGSSAVLERGFVTYSNAAKAEMLGVDAALIERLGAVSAEVAEAMAEGALAHAHADIAVSVTGIAGPDGGSDAKPVGTVHIGLASHKHRTRHFSFVFDGNRTEIRHASIVTALTLVEKRATAIGGKPTH
jgi:nicotinamide-nucleotide amidase